MKEEALRAVGLKEKEIKIYLILLQTGISSVQKISHLAGINRTFSYDILRSLEKKGFASFSIRNKKQYYQATHPNKIFDMIKEKENLVKRALPELKSICNVIGKKPRIEVYSGKEGIKSIFEDIIRTNDNFLCIASKTNLTKLFKIYFPYFVKRRIKQSINAKIITNHVPYDKTSEYKIIKKKFNTAIWIYGGKIAMISLEANEPMGLLIQEKNFVDTYRMMFDIIWNSV